MMKLFTFSTPWEKLSGLTILLLALQLLHFFSSQLLSMPFSSQPSFCSLLRSSLCVLFPLVVARCWPQSLWCSCRHSAQFAYLLPFAVPARAPIAVIPRPEPAASRKCPNLLQFLIDSIIAPTKWMMNFNQSFYNITTRQWVCPQTHYDCDTVIQTERNAQEGSSNQKHSLRRKWSWCSESDSIDH